MEIAYLHAKVCIEAYASIWTYFFLLVWMFELSYCFFNVFFSITDAIIEKSLGTYVNVMYVYIQILKIAS